ncbi:hypothetical protein C366_02628 [Cryptococcus neoformans Tu401-1]|nr:hypothetical protein C366_02628 [Cryptococcus neoformans var. grubii Tu401-1]
MVPNRTPKWISLKHVGLGTLSRRLLQRPQGSVPSSKAPKVTGGVFKPIILSTGGLVIKQRKHATSINPSQPKVVGGVFNR